MTVTIDSSSCGRAPFHSSKSGGASRLLQGPDNLATKGTDIHWGMGVGRTNHDNAFIPDWFRLSAIRGFAADVLNLNLQMDRLWQSR